MDIYRKIAGGKPVMRTIAVRNSVKNVKLPMNPMITPSGFIFPEVSAVVESTIGRTGNMHGESMVTIPAINANRVKSIMESYVCDEQM